MDASRRRLLLASLPALVQPPPDVTEYINCVRSCLVAIVMPPLDPVLDIRHRLFSNDSNIFTGRDIFRSFAENRYNFYNLTGETPETLTLMLNTLNIRNNRRHKLSPINRVLLFVIWIRCYPTIATLATMFNVSTAYVHVEIRTMIRTCYTMLAHYIKWPTVDQWRSKRGDWDKLHPAVGAIDGTSHEILRPMNEPQEQFYSGYRHFHAINTQVIVDSGGIVCHVESGFPGHLNDVQQFNLMPEIGGDHLPFPRECVLLGDKIYPNRHPLMTPYTAQQINRRDEREKRKCRKMNRLIQNYRVLVEHAIGEIKKYRSISSIWRHSRNLLPRVVKICACLVRRRKQLQLIH